jgi:ATP-dependent helicase/nuclease subunit B
MERFLDKVSRHIIQKYPDDLAGLCIVLPNRRAGLFLKKSLIASGSKTIWSPDIFSIEDFLAQISGLTPSDPIGLLFDFYEIHQQIEGVKAQSFDDFVQWGQVLLSDFNEIDKHLADAAGLFNYLSEAKAIEKWSPGNPHLSEAVKNYLRFYRSLNDYYHALRSHLESSQTAYQGLIYRKVAEQIEKIAPALKWKKIIFAGFNALTASEKKITTVLVNLNLAEMLWDADKYYLDNPNQEAGLFLRKELQTTHKEEFKWISDDFTNKPRKIVNCGVPKNLGQARYAANVLMKWSEEAVKYNVPVEKSLTDAAVVLADENMLFPLLSSLHDETPHFNVTMGYPVRFTIAFQFFSILIRVYENAERFLSVNDRKSKGFYYADLLKFLKHPWFRYFVNVDPVVLSIKQSNRSFYNPSQLADLVKEQPENARDLFEKIFGEAHPTPAMILENIGALITALKMVFSEKDIHNEDEGTINFDLEYLYQFSKINNRLKDLMAKYQSVQQVKTLKKLFDYILRMTNIPFEGEPLQGLQVMGMLETRTLDFNKLILLSVNEGTLPSASYGNSFIPYDIQREFGLPVIHEKNAVFAYHFYRLLQRAGEVHLVYNTESDALGGGEPSRFIHQLIHELPKYDPLNTIEQVSLGFSLPEFNTAPEIVIEKDSPVYDKLLKKANSGLSPTSINRYKSCPLKFYFSEIAEIQAPDEVEETLEMQSIGSIVHEALDVLYKPFLNAAITDENIEQMKQDAGLAMAAAFEKYYSGGDISYGRNRLISEVIKNFITNFLDTERAFLETITRQNKHLTILNLEEVFKASITLDNTDKNVVNLKGFIDRVDRIDDMVRIIDYKTGRVESKEFYFESFEQFAVSASSDKSFQVLMYAWLYDQNHRQPYPRYQSGVISMRHLSGGVFSFGLKENRRALPDVIIDPEKLQLFEGIMRTILNEMFDQALPFGQTDDLSVCKTCDFREICSR